jgi:hypothetical protein
MSQKEELSNIFARTTSITDDEWLKIINNRVESIKPHLDNFRLNKPQFRINSLTNTHDLCPRWSFRPTVPVQWEEGLSPETELILSEEWSSLKSEDNEEYHKTKGDYKMPYYIFALTIKGDWILISKYYHCVSSKKGLKSASVKRTTPEQVNKITGFSLQTIWEELNFAVRSCVYNFKKTFDDIEQEVVLEEKMFKMMPAEFKAKRKYEIGSPSQPIGGY